MSILIRLDYLKSAIINKFRRDYNSQEHIFGTPKNESFDFKLIEKYHRKKRNSDCLQLISDKTWNDLDIQELFMYIDRTSSKVGQQYLYNKLRVIPSKNESLEIDEELINLFTNDSIIRNKFQGMLEKLNRTDAYYISSLFQDEHLKAPRWYFLIRLLSFTSIALIVLMFFVPQAFFALIGIFIVNIGVHYWNKKNLYEYLNSIPQLLQLNGVAKAFFEYKFTKKVNPNLLGSIKEIDKIRNQMSFFKLETKLEADSAAVFWLFFELFKVLFLLEPLMLFGVLKKLDLKRVEIEEVFQFVGKIDVLISISSMRVGLNYYCVPSIIDGNKSIIGNEIFHPLIPACINNDIEVDNKSILLTGSNMSGKTSFIRAIGLNVISGLTLNTCFAKSMKIPLIRVFSAIRISDDLMNDKSYYFEEVLTVKEMVTKKSNGIPNLFLLDELFKGTNTIERISASKAVLSDLNRSNNIVFVSTHDIELADLLKNEYELFHFSEIIGNDSVDFDYKLKKGKLKTRNAIRILEINGYPEQIIKESYEIAKRLDEITIASNTNIKLVQ